MNKRGRIYKTISIFLLAGVILGGTYGRVMAESYFGSTVTEGVRVNGVDIGGLTSDEAKATLAKALATKPELQITFSLKEQKHMYPLQDVGLTPDLAATVDQAAAIGKVGSLQYRFTQTQLAKKGNFNLPLQASLNEKKFTQFTRELDKQFGQQPIDATFQVTKDGALHIVPEKNGYSVDKEALKQSLSLFNIDGTQPLIKLHTVESSPEFTAKEIQSMAPTQELGSATTSFDLTNKTRTQNIVIAASQLNNKLFAPGETISFNDTVGPRVAERGYQEAKVILKGKLVPGIGGGVCQVSSTLYNTVLNADLKIVRRSHHSLKVGYLPAGLDATVADNGLDFKFQNTTSGYIMLKTAVVGSKLTIRVLGAPKAADYDIKVYSIINKVIPYQTVKKYNSQLWIGQQKVVQKGQPGYKATAIREYWLHGKLVKKEVLSNDTYRPEDRIIDIGTRAS